MLKNPTSRRVVFIRLKTNALRGSLVIHNNFDESHGLVPAMVHSNFCPINFRWQGLGLPWLQRVTEELGLDPGEGA